MMGRSLITGLLVATLATAVSAAPPQRPISNPQFNPDARQVGLFEAMEEGAVETKMIPKNSLGGNLIITNTKPEPITVQIPAGFVGVPVSAQFGGGGGFGQGGGGFGQGGGQQGQQGGQQSVGGGQQGGMSGGGIGQGGGQQGFFSIPAKRAVIVPYVSVCLEHGKTEPNPQMKYAIMPVEKYTDNPALQKLVTMVGSGRMDPGAAQAAAWNVANGLSWQELASKKYDRLAAPDTAYFSVAQLQQAQQIVAAAESAAKNDPPVPSVKTEPSIRQTVRTAQ